MSEMGKGRPVDALDTVCKAYKDCQRCVRQKFAEQCIGEFVKYKYGERNGEKVCCLIKLKNKLESIRLFRIVSIF